MELEDPSSGTAGGHAASGAGESRYARSDSGVFDSDQVAIYAYPSQYIVL